MQRTRTPDGRFQSAAPYQHARGADGRFTAQRALQVENHPRYVASHAGNSESPVTALSWLKPTTGMAGMAGMLAAWGNLPTSLASGVSGAIIDAGEIVPGAADINHGTTSADGTRNASSRPMFAGAATRFPMCPHIPNLPIAKCGANIPRMPVRKYTELAMGCLHNPQSGDTCYICFCAMFHANPPLQDTVHAVDDILYGNSTAGEVLGAQMLEEAPFIDHVTNPNPFTGVKDLPSVNKRDGWHEAMVRIMKTLERHAENLSLPAVVKRFIAEYPHLVMALGGLGVGVSSFALIWFLRWLLKVLLRIFLRWKNADRGVNVGLKAGADVDLEAGVDVNLESSVKEEEEAEDEEELPPDTPSIPVGNTTITLVDRRIVGCKRLLQYRVHVENQFHETDNWASIPFLTEIFGSAEALRVAIENFESMSPQEDPRPLTRVGTMTKGQMMTIQIRRLGFS